MADLCFIQSCRDVARQEIPDGFVFYLKPVDGCSSLVGVVYDQLEHDKACVKELDDYGWCKFGINPASGLNAFKASLASAISKVSNNNLAR